MRNADMPDYFYRDNPRAVPPDKSGSANRLTKREEFARSVMQGDFAAQSPEHGEMLSAADCAHRAPLWVAAADALLAELEKTDA